METYKKFIITSFIKSFLLVFLVFFSLIFILSILTELDFFKNSDANVILPIYLAFLNSPSLLFEMFPFIFLISTQYFYSNLLNNNELITFKYSGLENIKIIKILSITALALGIIIISIFYSISSNLKNFYLVTKTNYTDDNKYLAVITQNGLWIKDVVSDKRLMINAAKIDKNLLLDCFISELDENFEIIRNIKSPKIDITNKEWKLYDSIVFENNSKNSAEILKLTTNYDYMVIQNLFSYLSSLSLLELFEMKKNYKKLNYSIGEINLHIYKSIISPIYFVLMTIFASILMLNFKKNQNKFLTFAAGLFFSAIFYYINIFFNVLAATEKMGLMVSIMIPLIILSLINLYFIFKINEK